MKKLLAIVFCMMVILNSVTFAFADSGNAIEINPNVAEPKGLGSGSITPYVIIGTDDREEVTAKDLKTQPYNAVALLKVEFEDSSMYVSGHFANNSTVITAGHCLYNTQRGGLAKKVTVYSSTGTAYTTQSFAANPAYVTSGGNSNDYGVVKITGRSGSSFGANYSSDVRDYTLYCTGYPDNNTVMYTASGDATTNGSTTFKHDVDTTGGQSGSPVYYTKSGTAGGYVVGIHVAGNQSGQYNVAVRMTKAIREWCIDY